jgi:hypothetical protein
MEVWGEKTDPYIRLLMIRIPCDLRRGAMQKMWPISRSCHILTTPERWG